MRSSTGHAAPSRRAPWSRELTPLARVSRHCTRGRDSAAISWARDHVGKLLEVKRHQPADYRIQRVGKCYFAKIYNRDGGIRTRDPLNPILRVGSANSCSTGGYAVETRIRCANSGGRWSIGDTFGNKTSPRTSPRRGLCFVPMHRLSRHRLRARRPRRQPHRCKSTRADQPCAATVSLRRPRIARREAMRLNVATAENERHGGERAPRRRTSATAENERRAGVSDALRRHGERQAEEDRPASGPADRGPAARCRCSCRPIASSPSFSGQTEHDDVLTHHRGRALAEARSPARRSRPCPCSLSRPSGSRRYPGPTRLERGRHPDSAAPCPE